MAPKRSHLVEDPPALATAPKRSRLVEDPPALAPAPSSSTSKEEENEEEEVPTPEESSEEDEDGQKNKSPPAVGKKMSPNKPSSSSGEEEDGSDSDCESDSQPHPNIKVMEETPARSKAEASVTPSPVKASTSTSKRLREIGLENNKAKSAKKKEQGPEEEEGAKKIGDDSKKQVFQRIWSEEDELVFLKGIADYSAKHGCVPYPNGNMNEFHDSIRRSLHCEFSKGQLTEKIRRLKRKYESNVSKAKLGEDPIFQKRHELKTFKLSKKIWGVEGNGNQHSGQARKTKANAVIYSDGDVKKAVMPANEPKSEPPWKHSSIITDFARLNEVSPTLDRGMEIGLGLLSESVKADLEHKWEEILEEEFQLYLKKVELIQMQVKAAMHAFRSRNR